MSSTDEVEDKAPEGQIWWCPSCGRISTDRQGTLATMPGWTVHCSRMAMLIWTETMSVDANGRVREAGLVIEQPRLLDGWQAIPGPGGTTRLAFDDAGMEHT